MPLVFQVGLYMPQHLQFTKQANSLLSYMTQMFFVMRQQKVLSQTATPGNDKGRFTHLMRIYDIIAF